MVPNFMPSAKTSLMVEKMPAGEMAFGVELRCPDALAKTPAGKDCSDIAMERYLFWMGSSTIDLTADTQI